MCKSYLEHVSKYTGVAVMFPENHVLLIGVKI